MRYYVTRSGQSWWVTAPEVPGTGSEDLPTRDAAIARCRELVASELDAYRRLGSPLRVSPGEEVIDWSLPWWLIPERLLPISPAVLRAVIQRMDDEASQLEGFVDELSPDEWDRRPSDSWSVRRILDHVAGGFGIGLRRLEPWPLVPDRAQETAVEELVAGLRQPGAARLVVEQTGMNQEAGRIRWTPRKVARVVGTLQSAWRAHLAGGPPPVMGAGHGDADGDDEPPSDAELRAILDADRELRAIAFESPRVRAIAFWYRYYRDRLTPWPIDERERWRAMRAAFRARLLSLTESELALVLMAPNGVCATVGTEVGLGISHVREHLAQMKRVTQ